MGRRATPLAVGPCSGRYRTPSHNTSTWSLEPLTITPHPKPHPATRTLCSRSISRGDVLGNARTLETCTLEVFHAPLSHSPPTSLQPHNPCACGGHCSRSISRGDVLGNARTLETCALEVFHAPLSHMLTILPPVTPGHLHTLRSCSRGRQYTTPGGNTIAGVGGPGHCKPLT